MPWPCLEGIPHFLASRDWVLVSGTFFEMEHHPGTLDGYLNRYGLGKTGNWVAPVLGAASVVYVWNERPVRVRLSPKFPIDSEAPTPEEPQATCAESLPTGAAGETGRIACGKQVVGAFSNMMLCEDHLQTWLRWAEREQQSHAAR